MTCTRRQLLTYLSAMAGLAALAACDARRAASPAGTPTSASAPVPTVAASLATSAPSPLSLTAAPTVPATGSAPLGAEATVQPAASGRLAPLFDTHLHYSQDAWDTVPVDRALALLDAVGTRLALLSSTPDDGTLRLYQAAPDRILPILRPYRTRDDMSSWPTDPTIPAYLEERLALGVHRGLGEFHVSGTAAASPVVARVARLATARGLVLHAHADEVAVAHLFDHAPAARVLWAHAGFTGPETVQEMLDRYAGLSVEFAFRSDIGAGGRLAPGWRALIERQPRRFMIGTDTYTPSRWTAMPAIVAEVRAWLVTLPPALAEALAWGNAAALMGIDPILFQT